MGKKVTVHPDDLVFRERVLAELKGVVHVVLHLLYNAWSAAFWCKVIAPTDIRSRCRWGIATTVTGILTVSKVAVIRASKRMLETQVMSYFMYKR